VHRLLLMSEYDDVDGDGGGSGGGDTSSTVFSTVSADLTPP